MMEDTVARDQSEGHKALLELEKNFNKKARSAALSIQGSQIQALTGFIHIFEQYPYPVVINAAILKLADWFRTYNNNVKYYVYRVFKEASDIHLAKVINVEETVRRILPVLGSNDSIARSITLRVLGCMSMIIAEKLDVQYGIIQQLELATDRIELEAAIWAGDQICARSNRFPSVIFSKVVNKLQDPTTPFDIKLRLVKIFRHMHQDIGMARQAKLTCLVLLQDPSTDNKLVIVTLRTLTLLLSEAVIDRKEQIDRLLDYALNDSREDVCYNALYDLVIMGRNDIMFEESHIIRLLQVIAYSKHPRTLPKAFQCAQSLIRTHQRLIVQMLSSSVLDEFMDLVGKCEEIMNTAIHNQRHTITLLSAQLLYSVIRIALTQKRDTDAMDVDMPVLPKLKELGHRVTQAITQVDLALIHQNKQSGKHKLKELLKVKADFCLLLDDWDCDSTFRDAYGMLTNANDDITAILLPYLSTISRKCRHISAWFPEQAVAELKNRSSKPSVYVNLIRLLMRTTVSSHELTTTLVQLLHQFGDWNEAAKTYQKNGWNLYLIGMEAGSCGWYELMHVIMKDLCEKVELEANACWLKALSLLALAEWELSQKQTSPNHYIKSLGYLKAMQPLDRPRYSQLWFIQSRMEFIQAIVYTRAVLEKPACKPKQMQLCAGYFRKIAMRYDFIAQCKFGWDKEMLGVMESYKVCALVCEHAARTLLGTEQMFLYLDPSLIPLIGQCTTEAPLGVIHTAEYMMNQNKKFLGKVISWEELSHLEADDRRETCGKDLLFVLNTILSDSLILPKSFFKSRKLVGNQIALEESPSGQIAIAL